MAWGSSAWNWQKPPAPKPSTSFTLPKSAISSLGGMYQPRDVTGAVIGGGAAAPQQQQYATYAPPSGHMVHPDYSGILGSFTADARNRFGAGLEEMKAQRLSGARSLINKLGVRDVGGLLEKVKQYGLSQADLEAAQQNPWSELKAIDFRKGRDWQSGLADRAARGGFRSGGTIGLREDIDRQAALSEQEATQSALEGLGTGLQNQTNWEREQRDAMEQAIAQQQTQLAAAYQPYWVQD